MESCGYHRRQHRQGFGGRADCRDRRQRPSPLADPGGPLHGPARRRDRRNDRQCRPSHPCARPPRLLERAPVDRRRLHDHLCQLPPHSRKHRRSPRPQTVLHLRPGDLCPWIVRLLACPHRPASDRAAGGSGLRRRLHHAGDPVDPDQCVPRRRRTGPGHRHLGRSVGARCRHRASGRRLPARALLVGFDLLGQRPHRGRGGHRRHRHRARIARSSTRPGSTSRARSCRRSV